MTIKPTSRNSSQAAGVSVKPEEKPLPLKFHDFSLGHYSGAKQTETPPNSARDSLDIWVTRKNNLRRAPGTSLTEAMGAHAVKQIVLQPGLDYTSELVFLAGAEVGVKRDVATVWTNPGLPIGNRFATALYGDILLITNGRNRVWYRNPRDPTFTQSPTIPNCVTMAVIAGRLFFGGSEIAGNFQPMGVSWTGSENFDDMDIENGAGDEVLITSNAPVNNRIVAMRPIGYDILAILCRSSIWIGRITGDPDRPLDFQERVPGSGCIAEPTAQIVHGGVIYLSDEGVQLFDGNDAMNIGDGVNSDILPLDMANLDGYHSMYNPLKKWYYLFTPTATFIYDVLRKRWYKRGLIAKSAAMFAVQFHETTWAEMVGSWGAQVKTWSEFSPKEAAAVDTYFIGTRAGALNLEKEDSASTNYFGVAQNPYWQSYTDEEQLDSNKLYTAKAARVEFLGAGVVEFLIDNNVSLGQMNFPVNAVFDVGQMKTNATGRAVMVKIRIVSGDPEIASFEIDVLARSNRRAADLRQAVAAVVTPDTGLRDSPYWARPLRTNVSTAQLIGKVEQGQSGFGATFQNGWNATFKRYGSLVKEVGNNGAYWAAGIGLTPGRLVDPAEVTIPIIIRIRDVTGVVRTAGATFGSVAMVIGHEFPWQNAQMDSARNIGFHSLGTGNWWSYFSANNRTRLRGVDLGIPITQLCELMVEIDGSKKEIRWYIDGVLKDTFPVVAADVTVPTTAGINPYAQLYHVCRPDAGVTLEFWHHMGIGTLVEIERTSVS